MRTRLSKSRSARRWKILIADDFEDGREMLREFLEGSGYRVLVAADGDEAVEVARRESPDLVVMDMRMPRSSGIDAIRALKSSDDTKAIHVIGFSAAHGSEGFERQAAEAGCEAYLGKPAPLSEIRSTIERILRRKR